MLTSSPLADAVIRAVAWDDGGAEFIFADGTIMSFVDNMNTFVAVRSNPISRHSQRTATQAAHQRQRQERRQVPPPTAHAAVGENIDSVGDIEDDKDDMNRELCFSAWTLSRDVNKVRAALHIFNSLTEQPRLLTPLLPSEGSLFPLSSISSTIGASAVMTANGMAQSCSVWQDPGPPINTLLLERRSDLFQRHTVLGTVRDWIPASSLVQQGQPVCPRASPRSCHIDVFTVPSPIGESAPEDNVASSAPEPSGCTGDPTISSGKAVPLGTVLELWCALRRVRMTVAVHRETFTVRWPAPVTRPDGSRLPASFHARDLAAWNLLPSSPSWSSCISRPCAASAPVLFTYVEQTFPVRDPPATWRTMLQLALELDAELSATEQELSAPYAAPAPPSHSAVGQSAMFLAGNNGGCATWEGSLPEPHRWSGALNQHRDSNPCRFSPLTASQAEHLAAPRTARAVDAMRALHPRGARLRWMYEGNHCGVGRDNPPAVYWCLQGGVVGDPTGNDSCSTAVGADASTAQPWGKEVVTWVAEDASVVRTTLDGHGYTIKHHRLHSSLPCATASAPAVYRLQARDTAVALATADKRLRSTIAPLRCLIRAPTESASARELRNGQEVSRSCAVPFQAAPQRRGDPNSMCMRFGKKEEDLGAAAPACAPGARPVVAIIDPQSLCCSPAPSTGRSQGDCTAALVTPACACSALAALTAAVGPSEQLIHRCTGSNTAVEAPSLMSLGGGAASCKSASWDAYDETRRLRFGRYLASVVDVAIQLSQVNCAAQRAADPLRPAADPSRLAAYCSTAPSSTLPPGAQGWPGSRSARSAATVSAPGSPSALSLIHLTSRLDGIGTFTALTNGTIRVHFDDRTLLTLTPGANELDEAQLLATCVLRNATRCTMCAVQCHPGHAMHRYLAYALPFRRYVYWRAVSAGASEVVGGLWAEGLANESETTAPQEIAHKCPRQGQRAGACGSGEWATAHDEASGSMASISVMEQPLLDESTGLLPSLRSCSLATSFGALDDDERVATVASKAVWPADAKIGSPHHQLSGEPPPFPQFCLSASNTAMSRETRRGACPEWGLVDIQQTLQAYYHGEVADAAAQVARRQALLERNEALSQATRALLRE
ncbi:hypothetical protein LSCM1_02784 [Leishmania martiniquensis]|uniref:C5orf34-like C-terminal domain-containing protein n=1 Tax=Leishmania martiniquensis TaxID=1580590 RepID=A0A836G7H9_9TRYP|nr:hypothetical protein LSCM1_02784 [Leishmania martiniquensis]